MVARVYTRHGGTAGASWDEITATCPFFDHNTPLIELGNSCQNGAASQGTFTVEDPTDSYLTMGGLYVPGHTVVRWTEDATGDELLLSQGRVSGEEMGRGTVLTEDYVEHVITVDDANVDLRGLAFTETWSRGEETDTERLYALQAYILNSTSSTSPTFRPSTTITVDSTHLAPDTNTVTMLAKDYRAGTQPQEVVDDCASQAAKIYGVVIHHTGGTSHLCLLYIRETDHDTYASPGVISDDVTSWNPDDPDNPVWEPHWDQGKGNVSNGQASISGLVSFYDADNFVYVNNTTVEDQQEVWIDVFSDSEAQGDLTVASARAAAIVDYRRVGDFTYRVSLLVKPEQHVMLCAGMSIPVDTAVIIGGPLLNIATPLRIAALNWQPNPDGRYWAHMLLGRGYRAMPASKGKVQLVLPPAGGG